MRNKSFSLPQMSAVDFSISYVDIDAESPLNHNESHIHKECEIYVNLSGDVSFEVENRIYPISRGSVIITRPYEFHHCIYRSNQIHKHYWITFSAEQSEEYLKMFFNRSKGSDNLIILEEDNLAKLCAAFDVLLKKETDFLKRRIEFLRIFHILNDGKRVEHIDTIDGIPEDVMNALRYMDHHLTDEVDIKELSNHCSVSVNTLERHFRDALGASPFVMLRKKRLIASMEYLRNGESVSEAALKSGFSDYSNYIQLFRKQFGITPLRYKKNFEMK